MRVCESGAPSLGTWAPVCFGMHFSLLGSPERSAGRAQRSRQGRRSCSCNASSQRDTPKAWRSRWLPQCCLSIGSSLSCHSLSSSTDRCTRETQMGVLPVSHKAAGSDGGARLSPLHHSGAWWERGFHLRDWNLKWILKDGTPSWMLSWYGTLQF